MHYPDTPRQVQRIRSKLDRLHRIWEERRLEVQQEIVGADPDQVIVIETVGSVERLAKAASNIVGLEFLADLDLDAISPDEDFFVTNREGQPLSGHLYLIMSNRQALTDLVNLWNRFSLNPNMRFDRGLTPFRDLFKFAKDIRLWGIQDRILDTGVLEKWQEALEFDANANVRFEVELWFRGSDALRKAKALNVRKLIAQSGGNVVSECCIPEISYHALLGELPREMIAIICNDPSTELVKCEDMMFLRPAGQMGALHPGMEGEPERIEFRISNSPSGPPLIAILDGLPVANHALLAGRLQIDDPDDWAAEYPVQHRVHGTAMASLIIHGDLSRQEGALDSPIYARPITKPCLQSNPPGLEFVPDDLLQADIIHRAVRRLFESDGSLDPVAPSVRIVHLAVADPTRSFINKVSPVARLLDWLSNRYGVLFVVAAGNCLQEIELRVTRAQFDQLSSTDREQLILTAIFETSAHRRILSPAESINALTVGAVHLDYSQEQQTPQRFDPVTRGLPSPISPFGSGFRRSIKPEILFCGGRQQYSERFRINQRTLRLGVANSGPAPGCLHARPGRDGDLTASMYSCGTSVATALVTRELAKCYSVIRGILSERHLVADFEFVAAPLLKAFAVHGAQWSNLDERLTQAIPSTAEARMKKSIITRWLGYGVPEFERVQECTGQRVTLFGFGDLEDGRAHEYHLPLPACLNSQLIHRRLTVTLAWVSPVSPNVLAYRDAQLWFEVTPKGFTPDRAYFDWQTVRRGTIQHEIFTGKSATPISDGDIITIKINCRGDAVPLRSSVPYGLVVTLEVAEGIDLPIYNQVRDHILTTVVVR